MHLDVTTKREDRPCNVRQVGMISGVVLAETFLSSEHHPGYHIAHKLVRDVVGYRYVPPAVCGVLVTEVGKDSCYICLPTFP